MSVPSLSSWSSSFLLLFLFRFIDIIGNGFILDGNPIEATSLAFGIYSNHAVYVRIRAPLNQTWLSGSVNCRLILRGRHFKPVSVVVSVVVSDVIGLLRSLFQRALA